MSKRNTSVRETRASKALAQFINDYGGDSTAVAEIIGCTRQALSLWEHGHRTPTLEFAYRIQRFTGIPMTDWLTDKQHARAMKVPT